MFFSQQWKLSFVKVSYISDNNLKWMDKCSFKLYSKERLQMPQYSLFCFLNAKCECSIEKYVVFEFVWWFLCPFQCFWWWGCSEEVVVVILVKLKSIKRKILFPKGFPNCLKISCCTLSFFSYIITSSF